MVLSTIIDYLLRLPSLSLLHNLKYFFICISPPPLSSLFGGSASMWLCGIRIFSRVEIGVVIVVTENLAHRVVSLRGVLRWRPWSTVFVWSRHGYSEGL